MNANRPQTFLQAIFLCLLLFGSSFCVRAAWLGADSDAFRDDPDAYRALAEGFATTGTLGRLNSDGTAHATAYRPPGYIWCISLFVFDGDLSRSAVAFFHLALGTFTSLLAARIGYIYSTSWLVAFFVALCTAIDPILVKQSTLIMTETLATFTVLLLWWIWVEMISKPRTPLVLGAWMTFLGVMAGMGCLIRPTNLAWSVVWILLGLMIFCSQKLWKGSAKKEGKQIQFSALDWLLFGLGVCIVIAPWAYRNKEIIGKWTVTTTHGGYTMLLANNPVLYDSIQRNGWDREWNESQFHRLWDRRRFEDPRDLEYWSRTEDDLLGQPLENRKPIQYGRAGEHPEVVDDNLASEVAMATIRSSPGTFLKSCLVRMSWFWAVAPYRSTANSTTSLAIGVWYSLLHCVLLAGLLTISVKTIKKHLSVDFLVEVLIWWVPAIALLISMVMIHSIFWSNMRMRAPIMPILYIFAAIIVSQGAFPVQRLFGFKPRTRPQSL